LDHSAQHIRFHDALLGSHEGHRISEEVPHGTNPFVQLRKTCSWGEIARLGFSRRSRNRYRAICEHLITFFRLKELGGELPADLAARFLEEYRVSDERMNEPGEGWRRHMAFGVKVLAECLPRPREAALGREPSGPG
jgi:hypothetical protein